MSNAVAPVFMISNHSRWASAVPAGLARNSVITSAPAVGVATGRGTTPSRQKPLRSLIWVSMSLAVTWVAFDPTAPSIRLEPRLGRLPR